MHVTKADGTVVVLDRHFEPGPDVARVLRIGEHQIGLMICEDGWNDRSEERRVGKECW